MQTYNPSLPLISIHIPKCAGTSFRAVLQTWFGQNLLWHYHDEVHNTPPVKHNLREGFLGLRYRHQICIHGHFNRVRHNGVEDYYPDVKQRVTIVRDPFEVHLSNFFFIKRLQEMAYSAGKKNPLVNPDYALTDYLRDQKKSYLLAFFPVDISLDNYKKIINDRYIYIGLAEDLQTSVNVLARKLGFTPVAVPTANESPRTQAIPAEAGEEFIQNNPLEMAIYNHIKETYQAI